MCEVLRRRIFVDRVPGTQFSNRPLQAGSQGKAPPELSAEVSAFMAGGSGDTQEDRRGGLAVGCVRCCDDEYLLTACLEPSSPCQSRRGLAPTANETDHFRPAHRAKPRQSSVLKSQLSWLVALGSVSFAVGRDAETAITVSVAEDWPWDV
jgi:hypothetical protein